MILRAKFYHFIFLSLIFSFFFGCAVKGPAFEKISTIPEEKGLIYIYRSASIVGSAVSYSVFAGAKDIGHLRHGGYLYHFADPGELEIWGATEAKGSVTLDVTAGQEHYVKCSLGMGLAVGRPKLIIVNPERGRKEIKKCKLIKTK